jgi:hypothetical protein
MGQEKTIINPVVVMLNQVLSELESLVLDPRVITEKVKSFGLEKKASLKVIWGIKEVLLIKIWFKHDSFG